MKRMIARCVWMSFLAWASFSGAEVEKAKRAYLDGDYEKAERLFRLAANEEKGSGRYRLRFAEGSAAYRLGRFPQAATAFSEALQETDPSLQEQAHYNLANTLMAQGKSQLEQAKSAQERELSLPNALGQLREALPHYEDCLRLNPKNQKAQENMAELKKMIEDLEKEQEKNSQEQQKQDSQEKDDSESQEKNDSEQNQKDQKDQGDQDSPSGEQEQENEDQDSKEKQEGEESRQDQGDQEKGEDSEQGSENEPEQGEDGDEGEEEEQGDTGEQQDSADEESEGSEGENNADGEKDGTPSDSDSEDSSDSVADREAEENGEHSPDNASRQRAPTASFSKRREDESPEDHARRILAEFADLGVRPPLPLKREYQDRKGSAPQKDW